MAKTPLDEVWRYCARCGYRHAVSNLQLDAASGKEYCTAQVHCADDPNPQDQGRTVHLKGRVFDR